MAAGVRRVEAVTGANALAYLQDLESTVHSVAATLKTPAAELQGRLAQVLEQVRALEREVGALKGSWLPARATSCWRRAVDVKGIKVLAAKLDGADAKTLRETMDKLKDKLKSAAIVLAAVDGGKVQIAAGVTADAMGRIKAGELVNFVAQQVGGKGGGKPDMAMAGGTDAAGLPAALKSVEGWVRRARLTGRHARHRLPAAQAERAMRASSTVSGVVPGGVLVMGAGSVGCYVGGCLAAAGVPVTLVGRARVLDAVARSAGSR